MAKDRVNKPHIMCHQIFGQMLQIPPELANNIRDSNYWSALAAELMKRVSQVPTKTLPKDDK